MRHPSGRMLVSVTGESNDNNPSWSKILFESDGMTEAEKPQSDIGRVRRGGRGARREIRSAHDFTMLPALKRNFAMILRLKIGKRQVRMCAPMTVCILIAI